jgi:hypothetical protein
MQVPISPFKLEICKPYLEESADAVQPKSGFMSDRL